MTFLSNGDFSFPFTLPFYWMQQFYLWSYQNGAANPDGIIRIPSRLIDLFVFAAFGNLAVGYFFLVSSLVIAFLSFFYFAGKFLRVKSLPVRMIGALFFTLNPVFLGNVAKVGLVLAAAMLPLCIVMIQKGFAERKLRYFLVWLVLLNISFIHPFTLTINAAVSGLYFLYKAHHHRDFIRAKLKQFALLLGLALLLNAYFIIPLASMHTVSKGVLSNTATSVPTNYTALVNVLNTGNIFTGLSLSKNVVIDFSFYNGSYEKFYFLGIFVFYALLIGLYLKTEKRLSLVDKRMFTVFLGGFLLIIALATVLLPGVGDFIRLLINSPGGWAFRSPLKWQLYLPMVVCGMLVLVLKQVGNRKKDLLIYACLLATFLLMNGFLFSNIYSKLLVPRKVHYFASLQKLDLEHKNILFVESNQCTNYGNANPRVMTELNQILISKDTQLKQTSASDINSINMGSYDYIIGCEGDMRAVLGTTYNFKLQDSFAGNTLQLYANKTSVPYIYATSNIYALSDAQYLGSKYDFATQSLGGSFNYLSTSGAITNTSTAVQDLFDNLSFSNIQNNSFHASADPLRAGAQKLYVKQDNGPLYYKINGNNASFTTLPGSSYQKVNFLKGLAVSPLTIPGGKSFNLTYTDPNYQYSNLIPNPLFKQGLWQKTVGDCYNYDDNPELSMSLTKGTNPSLELQAESHIACTGPQEIPVEAGQQYLLSFSYKSETRDAGYYVSFDDNNTNPADILLSGSGTGWHSYTTILTAPAGAKDLHLLVIARPDDANGSWGTADYKDFKLATIPSLQGRFFLVNKPTSSLIAPQTVRYDTVNPTKTLVTIRTATTPFYLLSSETYSPEWRLELNTAGARSWSPLATVAAVPTQDHANINGTMNGWYIDPAALCKSAPTGCTRNPDGSYNIQLLLEYSPQRWFYAGASITVLTLLGCAGYGLYSWRFKRLGKH